MHRLPLCPESSCSVVKIQAPEKGRWAYTYDPKVKFPIGARGTDRLSSAWQSLTLIALVIGTYACLTGRLCSSRSSPGIHFLSSHPWLNPWVKGPKIIEWKGFSFFCSPKCSWLSSGSRLSARDLGEDEARSGDIWFDLDVFDIYVWRRENELTERWEMKMGLELRVES